MARADFTWLTFGAGVSLVVRNFSVIVPVVGDDLQNEIGFARQHVALAHMRP
jgi:hypothetical protein